MKVLQKYYPDDWSHCLRLYKDQSNLEKHLIQFCTALMESMVEKSIRKLLEQINKEICSYLETAKGKAGTVTLKQVTTASYVGSDKKAYGIVLVRGGRYPFFEISEPI